MNNKRNITCGLAALLAIFFGGCLGGGTEIPNEVTGTLYTASGDPAVNAKVNLYPVDYAPGDEAALVERATRTDSDGRYRLKKIPGGEYNLVASSQGHFFFRDSLLLTSGALELPPDTLRTPGTVTATIRLQPQHSPQTAVLQVLGTQYYSNVPASGTVTLTLPQGIHRLRVSVSLPQYTPLYRTVVVFSGVNDTLAEPLEPFYSEIPVVTGLTAVPDSSGVIMLVWKRPAGANVQSYLIYRDSVGVILPSSVPYASTTDTIFRDTLYSTDPMGTFYSPTGRYHLLDTISHSYRYRVRVLDNSDKIGPVFGSVLGTPIPPALKYNSGRWHRALINAPFGQRLNPSVVSFNNALWLFGGGLLSTWKSSDGTQWQKVSDTLPVPTGYSAIRAAVMNGRIWLLAGEQAPVSNQGNFKVLSSEDGISWSTMNASLPSQKPYGILLTLRDTLWVFGVSQSAGPGVYNTVRSSVDGVTWSSASPLDICGAPEGVAIITVFTDKFWIAGGHYGSDLCGRVRNSSDGKTWVDAYTPRNGLVSDNELLPRSKHTMATHEGRMWLLGGEYGFRISDLIQTSHVWSSSDGVAWDIIDVHPFAVREQPAAISFNGRLWVIGGIQADGTNDIWYYE